MTWLIAQDVLRRAAARVARILLIALLGAIADAGLLDGQLGDGALHALHALSFRSLAEPVALLLLPSSLA